MLTHPPCRHAQDYFRYTGTLWCLPLVEMFRALHLPITGKIKDQWQYPQRGSLLWVKRRRRSRWQWRWRWRLRQPTHDDAELSIDSTPSSQKFGTCTLGIRPIAWISYCENFMSCSNVVLKIATPSSPYLSLSLLCRFGFGILWYGGILNHTISLVSMSPVPIWRTPWPEFKRKKAF